LLTLSIESQRLGGEVLVCRKITRLDAAGLGQLRVTPAGLVVKLAVTAIAASLETWAGSRLARSTKGLKKK